MRRPTPVDSPGAWTCSRRQHAYLLAADILWELRENVDTGTYVDMDIRGAHVRYRFDSQINGQKYGRTVVTTLVVLEQSIDNPYFSDHFLDDWRNSLSPARGRDDLV